MNGWSRPLKRTLHELHHLIQDLLHFGGQTREKYLKHNPTGETDGQAEKIYAPPVIDVLGGESTSRSMAILTLKTGDPSRPMNLHLAADATILRKLIATARSRLAELGGAGPDPRQVH